MGPLDYSRLPTEQTNPRSGRLDLLSIPQIIRLMSQEDRHTCDAVRRSGAAISRGVALVRSRLGRGGNLIFVGAGTSGRLGVIEAAECPPTFNTAAGQVRALMAGGRQAVFRSQEGAEDSESDARRAV